MKYMPFKLQQIFKIIWPYVIKSRTQPCSMNAVYENDEKRKTIAKSRENT